MKRSSAATTAAASSGEAGGRDDPQLGAAVGHARHRCHVHARDPGPRPRRRARRRLARRRRSSARARPSCATTAASGRCRRRSTSTAPGYGDFRAMPARGDGLAMLKWISSFPGNPAHGLPTVMGVVVPQRRDDERAARAARRALGDRAAHRRGRGGRRAGARARRTRATVGIVGCGLHGAWAARCLAAAGYGAGRLQRPARRGGARRWPTSSAWLARRPREAALACDVVCCVTPGRRARRRRRRPAARACTSTCSAPTARARRRRRSRRSSPARCSATSGRRPSHGGELTGAVEAGLVTRDVGHRPRRRPGRRGAGRARTPAR